MDAFLSEVLNFRTESSTTECRWATVNCTQFDGDIICTSWLNLKHGTKSKAEMSSPTHMVGNITSWVARHVINNVDGENLNCDDAVVSDISHEFCPGCTDFNFADAPPPDTAAKFRWSRPISLSGQRFTHLMKNHCALLAGLQIWRFNSL